MRLRWARANHAGRNFDDKIVDLNVALIKGSTIGGGRRGARVRQVVAILHGGVSPEVALQGLGIWPGEISP